MHRIMLYLKPDCPNCETTREMITRLVSSHADVLVEEVDITKNPQLLVKFKDVVPVLFVDDVERFRGHVDPDKLSQIFYDELGEKFIGF